MSSTDPATGPASSDRPQIRLRPATEEDWPLIRRWLAQPEIVRWWGPKTSSEAEVMLAMSSEPAISRIIQADGADVGYAHAVDAGLWGDPLPDALPPGAWDIDLFVAAPALRGKGVGVRALELLRDEVFQTTLAVAVCIFTAIGNELAVRAYEKAGFRWRAVVRDPVLGPEWLLLAERPVD